MDGSVFAKAEPAGSWLRRIIMNIAMTNAVISIVAGIVILIQPKLLNYIVALYLIIVGVVGLLPHIS
jgi:hypothetical protein